MDRWVAVTGGSGFIGSHVVDHLVDAGYRVKVVDERAPHRDDVEWEPVDILDQMALVPVFKRTEAIFHLAAMADVNDVYGAPADGVAVNIQGTTNVLEAARNAEGGRVILASTIWVFDATTQLNVDEETHFEPHTDRHLYVTTKVASEMLCRDYAHLYKRPFTVLRYGIPYGPRMRSNLVLAAFMRRAMSGEALRIDGDGSQSRHFIFVGDLARAHVLALSPNAENRTYNLPGAAPVTIREVAETVGRLVGNVEVEFGPSRPGDLAPVRRISAERAKAELGWEPKVGFAEGAALTYEWFKTNVAAPAIA